MKLLKLITIFLAVSSIINSQSWPEGRIEKHEDDEIIKYYYVFQRLFCQKNKLTNIFKCKDNSFALYSNTDGDKIKDWFYQFEQMYNQQQQEIHRRQQLAKTSIANM